MDQQKTGSFLKRLRKQNGMTQEQLAERLGVTARTVSRWETGSNLPDLSLLIEIADLYRVDIREIIDGERKDDTMDQETKDTLKKAAEYTDAEKERLKKRMAGIMTGAAILLLFSVLLEATNGFGFIPAGPRGNMSDFAVGLALGVFVLQILYLYGVLDRIRAWKLRVFRK